MQICFWHRDRAINQMYIADPAFGGYNLTYENAQYSQQYGMQLTGSVKPFGNNLLVVKVVLLRHLNYLRLVPELFLKIIT